MAAGSIVIDLLMKTGSFETDTQRAEKALNRLKKEAQNASSVVGNAFTGLAAGIAAAFTVDAIVQFTKQTIDAMDALNDLADATGASIENISALENVASKTGVSMDTVGTALVKFNSVLADATPGSKYAEILKSIGLNADELRRLDPAESLRLTAVALSEFADNGNKARIVQELFGKSVKEVAPFLKDLSEQTQLVGTTTTEQAAAAEKFNKQLFEMQTQLKLAARAIVSDMLPAVEALSREFQIGMKHSTGFFDAILRMGTINPFKTHQENVASLTEELADLQKARERYAKSGSDTRGLDQAIDNTTRKLAYLKELLGTMPGGGFGAGGGRGFVNPPIPESRPSAPGIAEAVKETPLSDAQKYLESLNKQLQTARELSVEEKLLEDIQAGRLKGINPKLQEQLLATAKQIDALKEMDKFEKAMWDFEKERDKARQEAEHEQEKAYERLMQAGQRVFEETRTPMEQLELRLASLSELLINGAIDWDTYSRAATKAGKDATDALKKASEDDYWGKWLEGAEKALTSFDKLGGEVLNNFSAGFGNAFESMIFDSESLGDAIDKLAEGMLRSIVNALGQMAAQWVAYQLVQAAVGQTTAAAAATSTIANALVSQQMAALNAFASTAAIPVVGPAAAPAAAAAALAATTPFVATISSMATTAIAGARADGGPVAAGSTYLVGERGPELFTPHTSGAIVPNEALGGGNGKMNLTIVNNTSAPIGKVTERQMSPTDRALIIEEAVAATAAQMGDPNSRTSKSLSNNFRLQRAR